MNRFTTIVYRFGADMKGRAWWEGDYLPSTRSKVVVVVTVEITPFRLNLFVGRVALGGANAEYDAWFQRASCNLPRTVIIVRVR